MLSCRCPVSARGALRDRHERWKRDAMDALARETSAADANSEVVWSWCPDAGTKLRSDELRDDGGKKARSPGRARISCKTIAQGRPDSRLNLWFLPRAFLLHGGRGYQSIPGLPCALRSRRERISCKARARWRCENDGVRLDGIDFPPKFGERSGPAVAAAF